MKQKGPSDSTLAKYHLTLEQYEEMLAGQDGLCWICRKPPAHGKFLAVDHCHRTGKVRGLLCFNCNTGLGCFDDDPALFKACLEYLEHAELIEWSEGVCCGPIRHTKSG